MAMYGMLLVCIYISKKTRYSRKARKKPTTACLRLFSQSCPPYHQSRLSRKGILRGTQTLTPVTVGLQQKTCISKYSNREVFHGCDLMTYSVSVICSVSCAYCILYGTVVLFIKNNEKVGYFRYYPKTSLNSLSCLFTFTNYSMYNMGLLLCPVFAMYRFVIGRHGFPWIFPFMFFILTGLYCSSFAMVCNNWSTAKTKCNSHFTFQCIRMRVRTTKQGIPAYNGRNLILNSVMVIPRLS